MGACPNHRGPKQPHHFRWHHLDLRGPPGSTEALPPVNFNKGGLPMPPLFLASHVTLWILVGLLTLVVLTLSRRFNARPEPVSPQPASLPVGTPFPPIRLRSIQGDEITIPSGDGPAIVSFASASCGACKSLYAAIGPFLSRHASLRLILVILGESDELKEIAGHFGLVAPVCMASDADLKRAGITGFPFSYYVTSKGVIRGARVTNFEEHLELLVTSTGSRS